MWLAINDTFCYIGPYGQDPKRDGRYAPVLYCDACRGRITEPRMAVVLFDGDPVVGETCGVMYAHKGECDKKLQQRGKQGKWSELRHHMVDLASNVGLPPATLVEIQAEMDGPLGIRNFA